MDIRQLRYFLAVAENRSISEASRALYIAQPALTKQLHSLEDELGVQLLTRLPRGVELTPAGRQFFDDAARLIEDLEAAKLRAKRAEMGRLGSISVGITVQHSLLPVVGEILRAFKATASDVTVSLRPVLSGPQAEQIRAGELDVGFLFFRPVDDPTLCGFPVYSEKLVVAMPNTAAWTDNPPRRLSDLKGRDFIWFPRRSTPLYYDQLIACFRRAGFSPSIAMEGDDNMAVLSLVVAGMGCSVLPEMAKLHAPASVRFVSLDDLDLRIPLELCWRSGNESPVVSQFIEVARASLGNQAAPGTDAV
jgi:DNA-binding transcriptional LysR family regulator